MFTAKHRRPYTLLFLARLAAFLAGLCLTGALAAQPQHLLDGHWRINRELSDDTDRQVEKALRAAGQKVRRRLFGGGDERYRGGPEEHALYDHISYDSALHISASEDLIGFRYEHNGEHYERKVYTDGRNRSASLSALGEVPDFSFGNWAGQALLVEARPRDGGFTEERYELTPEGRLRVELYIQPRSFSEPIELLRIYDRVAPDAAEQ